MLTPDMLSINNVAAKLGLSVHQLRRWELMFNLEIKRGRGQQRQYREEDMSVLERIKDLVEQGWPTSQIRPQLEAEGLLTPRLIGVPPTPGNPEVLQEAIIGLRNFSERRFIDISRQIDELRQLIIKTTVSQELSADRSSPWQPMASEFVPKAADVPEQEITIGPQISLDPPKAPSAPVQPPQRTSQIPPSPISANAAGAGLDSLGSPSAYPSSSPTPAASGAPASTSPTSYSGANSPAASQSASTNFSPTDSRASMPKVDEAAPKPITDALQRSMSTLDSLWKDPRATGTSSATSHPAIVSGFDEDEDQPSTESSTPAAPAVRHSTIPPVPVTQATQPAQPAPAVAETNTGSGSAATAPVTSSPVNAPVNSQANSPNNYGSSSAGTSATSLPAMSGQTSSSTSTPQISAPTALSGSLGGTASGSSNANPGALGQSPSQPTTQAPAPIEPPRPEPAKASAWDQAFASTSVDINALPKSGLFEDKPLGTASSTNSGINPASLEHNPFTTITGTNYNAVSETPPQNPQHSALLGQTAPSGTGFSATLNQTGPLPTVAGNQGLTQDFQPDNRSHLIEAQSNTTSSDLPEASTAPDTTVPASASMAQPVTPAASGPQVNFGPNVSAPTPNVTPQRVDDNFGLGEVTDQNYLTVLGRALDLIGWSDEQADSYSLKTFGVPHWDELGRSQAEKLVAHLVSLLKDQLG